MAAPMSPRLVNHRLWGVGILGTTRVKIAIFVKMKPPCLRARYRSRSKQNAKIVAHTILELIFDTCTRARKRPSLAL